MKSSESVEDFGDLAEGGFFRNEEGIGRVVTS